MRRTPAFAGLLALAFALLALLPGAVAQEVSVLSHYIVFEVDASGAAVPVFYRQVNLPTSFFEQPAAPTTPDRDAEEIGVRLVAANGATIFAGQATMPVWMRGEFHGETPDAPIEGHRVLDSRPSFVVRAPLIPGASLVLESTRAATSQTFDMGALAADTTLPLADFVVPALEADAPADTGSSANRVDMLVMGDGYTSAQAGLFDTHFTDFIDNFFGIYPYDEYRSFVKVEKLFLTSAESGADHPPYSDSCSTDNYAPACCRDTGALSDTLAGQYVDTALDATFCGFQIHRLLVVNSSKVNAAASAYPAWDQMMVMVNDPVYGGAGGRFSTFSRNDFALQVAQHEYGHSFARLADEYSSSYPGYPLCSDGVGTTFPCEANVTNLTAREQIKWNRWIEAETPVLTPPTQPYLAEEVSGVFAGARYDNTPGVGDYYRPGYSCIMRVLGAPYCEVAAEAYALRLYQGGFSSTYSGPGIKLIEPGTASPATSSVTSQICQDVTFSVQILAPLSGATVEWRIDGLPAGNSVEASGTVASLTAAANSLSVGGHTVVVNVRDGATFIHPDNIGLTGSSQTWNLTVQNTTCASADVQPTYRGRPEAPSEQYRAALQAVLKQGSTTVIDTSVTADDYGRITLSYYQPGTYTLWIKGAHTLAASVPVTLTTGSNTVSGFTLPEGDADNSNVVNILDFSLLAASFGQVSGAPLFDIRTDFNQDGTVNILDFSLLAESFGQLGAAQ